jgi:uncharacterized membrane protein YciS (DUF1049 family)
MVTFALGFLAGWLIGGFLVFKAWDRETERMLADIRKILKERQP